jgi:DNA-binding response OmpR family regulator
MRVGLVVLDYSMPNMNGAQIARTMRGEKRNVPIVMLSGHSNRPHDVDDAVNAYIVKGQSPQVLLREMQELLWQQSVEAFFQSKAV